MSVSLLQGVPEAWGRVSLICEHLSEHLWKGPPDGPASHKAEATTQLPDLGSGAHLRNGILGLMVCVSET